MCDVVDLTLLSFPTAPLVRCSFLKYERLPNTDFNDGMSLCSYPQTSPFVAERRTVALGIISPRVVNDEAAATICFLPRQRKP